MKMRLFRFGLQWGAVGIPFDGQGSERVEKKMKRTHIEIDEQLANEGLKLTGLETMKELVDRALRDLVRRERQKRLLELKGAVPWDGRLREMRGGRTM